MAQYRISGIWKLNGIISHYAVHTLNADNTVTIATKMSKAQAVALLEQYDNSAYTWVWNYKKAFWDVEERIVVVNGIHGKYLRSNPDNQTTDNLTHLINYEWVR